LAYQNQITENQEKIRENQTEIYKAGQRGDQETINNLEKQNQELVRKNALMGEILNSEDAQLILKNTEQLVNDEIEIMASGMDDSFNKMTINSMEDLVQGIKNGSFGEDIKSYYNSVLAVSGEEAANE
jgi:hypothetical protein